MRERAPLRPRSRALGGAGTRISGGVISDIDANAEVRGSKWYGSPGRIGLADKMLRDPHVRKSVEYIVDPLRAADWRFQPASDSEVDREVADFCQYAFIECLNWDQVLRRQIRSYVTYGFSIEEMTDDARSIPASRFPNHPGGSVGIVPTGVHHRPAWTVDRWYQSRTNPAQVKGVRQHLQGSDGEPARFVDVSAKRLIRLTHDQDGANYEGLAVLRSAYGPWKLKQAFQTIDAIKHERLGVGTPLVIASEDATDEDLDAAETILAEMRVNEKGFVVLPYGYTFEWAGSTGNGTDINAAIERCNKDIAINVSAGFMLLSLMGKTGSNALGSTQEGQYHIYTEGHAKFVASGWNIGADGWSPVERIVRINYGDSVGLPRLVARNLPTRDWLKLAPIIYTGVQSGVITADDRLEAELRDGFRIGPHDPTTARARPFSAAEATGADVTSDPAPSVPAIDPDVDDEQSDDIDEIEPVEEPADESEEDTDA